MIEKTNEENFIEIFADGIQTVFNLSHTDHRALVIVLEECQIEPSSTKSDISSNEYQTDLKDFTKI
ncbi:MULTISPECIES: hypothetical protein [unclassified Bartonella]|uniref:hypothetical protein n=1 Tax=unclassified Bartonella TaxID=2645622 RepID=UPI0035CF7256